METSNYLAEIQRMIGKNRLDDAIEQLKLLFEHSPKLRQVLLQSSRYSDVMSRIQQGTLSTTDADLTLNQIRLALLDLSAGMDEQFNELAIQQEVAEALSVIESKNVVIGANITASGNVQIGDTNITETKTSRIIRIWLFVLLPVLVIGGAWLWYRSVILSQPLTLKVLVDNTSPNPNLPEQLGTLRLTYGGKTEEKRGISTETMFEHIPASFRGEELRLEYKADGFVELDTSFIFTEVIRLSVSRNDDLAVLEGFVYQDGSDPLRGISGVKVSIPCCADETDASGKFHLIIPLEYQHKQQRIDLFHPDYQAKSITEPVIKGVLIRTYLTSY